MCRPKLTKSHTWMQMCGFTSTMLLTTSYPRFRASACICVNSGILKYSWVYQCEPRAMITVCNVKAATSCIYMSGLTTDSEMQTEFVFPLQSPQQKGVCISYPCAWRTLLCTIHRVTQMMHLFLFATTCSRSQCCNTHCVLLMCPCLFYCTYTPACLMVSLPHYWQLLVVQ